MSDKEVDFDGAFSPIRQPNGITCGPTCLVTLVRALTILQTGRKDAFPGPDALRTEIQEVGRRMGTCFEYGTRHVEMEAGLRLFGLPVIRSIGGMGPDNDDGEWSGLVRTDAWEALEGTILDGNAILLRTLWEGCKHWVLLCGNAQSGLFLIEPAAGRKISLTDHQQMRSKIVNAWRLRGYDGFSVPLSAVPRLLSAALSDNES